MTILRPHGLVAAAALAAGMLAPLAVAPASRAQEGGPPPPCAFQAAREVGPLSVFAGDTTAVTVTVDPGCRSYEEHGVDLFFVVDRSETMGRDQYFEPARNGLRDFIAQLNTATTAAGIITFAQDDSVLRNLSRDREDLLRAVDGIRLTQETEVRGLLGAVRTATQKLDNDGTPGNDKVVIILVAGSEANEALVTMPTVTQAARNIGVKFVFLMFPDARFTHFVASASECYAGCPSWRGPRAGDPITMKWAWGVEREGTNGVRAILGQLATRLLRPATVTEVELWEGLGDDVTMDPGSAVPPPTRTDPPLDYYWTMTNLVSARQVVGFRARMGAVGTYPVSLRSELRVQYSDGFRQTLQLDNPDVLVQDPALRPTADPTATRTPVPATATPTETTAPPPTATATAGATATATSEAPSAEHTIYLPCGLSGAPLAP